MVLSGLNVLAGIWLIIAPSVLGYSPRDPRWNDVVFGIVIGVLSLIRASGGVREDWMSAVNALIGIWLIVAAFTIDQTATAMWNDIILGIVVFVLAIASVEAGPRKASLTRARRLRHGARVDACRPTSSSSCRDLAGGTQPNAK